MLKNSRSVDDASIIKIIKLKCNTVLIHDRQFKFGSCLLNPLSVTFNQLCQHTCNKRNDDSDGTPRVDIFFPYKEMCEMHLSAKDCENRRYLSFKITETQTKILRQKMPNVTFTSARSYIRIHFGTELAEAINHVQNFISDRYVSSGRSFQMVSDGSGYCE